MENWARRAEGGQEPLTELGSCWGTQEETVEREDLWGEGSWGEEQRAPGFQLVDCALGGLRAAGSFRLSAVRSSSSFAKSRGDNQ